MPAPVAIHADVESRSRLSIKIVGAYRYWQDPSTEPLMMSYRIADGGLDLWDRSHGTGCPRALEAAIRDGSIVVAHNAEFEILAFRWLANRYGWPSPGRWRCTAAMASAMGLPRDLESLGEALGLKHQKDPDGDRLIKRFCQPRRNGSWNEPEDFPHDYERFQNYCRRDVESEEEAENRMIQLSDAEADVWRLGQTINDRGIRIDRRSAEAALVLAERAVAEYDGEMAEATSGHVPKCSAVQKLAEWINGQGVATDSADKTNLLALLDLDLPSHVKRAIRLRLLAGKTSVSKLKKMLLRCGPDDRVRGAFVYHAAGTGRFQSFGVNFANLPRPRKIFEGVRPYPLFQAIRSGDPRVLRFLYGDDLGSPMHLLADAIRGFIWAGPGKKLVVADYSGIEGIIVAWLAGEEWKLKAFQEIIDDPSKPDMYRQTAAQIMDMPVELLGKKHPFRQSVGKVSELALGFGGGVGAFASMARTWQVDLTGLYGPVWERSDELLKMKAERRYEGALSRKERTTQALTREQWIACELIKLGWRATNAAIARSWLDLEDAARSAVREPGKQFEAARVTFLVKFGYLFMKLPSDRCLAYPAPKLKAQVRVSRLVDGVWAESEVMDASDADKLEAMGVVRIEGRTWPKVTAAGVDQTTRKFKRYALYGGLLAENATQATARDILVNGMWKAEAAGYPVIGTVYDEIITEVDRDFGDAGEFSRLICDLPRWAAGMPLSAGGFEAKRYRKD